ncbi:MAG: class I SAM-dependent methyltransferase [Phycisphaerales bacterium]|nr:MAG: class I SAM-dependent methyltransferase [Phycisphaerales bacterium]
MSVEFEWPEEEFDYLLESCDQDPVTPYVFKYLPKHGPILEAGCGSGRFVKYLHDRGYDCRGIENCKSTVENVRKKWPELDILEGDVEQMPYPDNMFEGIISIGVIEHFKEGPARVLGEMRRVLAPGGVALVTVPSLNWLRRLKGPFCGMSHMVRANTYIRNIFGKKPHEHPGWNLRNPCYKYHVWPEWGDFFEYRFTPSQFKEILRVARYQVIESVPIHHIGGLYHEFGRLAAKYVHCRFVVYPHTRLLNRVFSRIPFFHNHMHLCVVRKNLGAGE